MPLTPQEAADVARRHGLSLQDAAGLLTLAKDAEEADQIAASFAAPDTEAATRELAARLFGRTPPADAPGPKPSTSPDIEARRFAHNLFHPND